MAQNHDYLSVLSKYVNLLLNNNKRYEIGYLNQGDYSFSSPEWFMDALVLTEKSNINNRVK